jgi:hypothetical protein
MNRFLSVSAARLHRKVANRRKRDLKRAAAESAIREEMEMRFRKAAESIDIHYGSIRP